MKKTQLTDFFKNIKVNIVSFVAIVLFISLGIALYCGLNWTGKATIDFLNNSLKLGKVHSFDVVIPLGVNETEAEKILEVDGVDSIELYNSSYQFFVHNNNRYQALVSQLTKDIDIPLEIEGVLPNKDGEIAIEKEWAKINNIKIGDTITFEHDKDGTTYSLSKIMDIDPSTLDVEDIDFDIYEDSKSNMTYLNSDQYKVTALLETAVYLHNKSSTYGVSASNALPINVLMFVDKEAFNLDAFNGYSHILVSSNKINNMDVLSDEYVDADETLKTKLSKVAEKLAGDKYDEVVKHIDKIKDKIENEFVEADESLMDAKIKLEASKEVLSFAQDNLDKAITKLNDAKDEIARGEAELNNGKNQVTENEKLLRDTITMALLTDEKSLALYQFVVDNNLIKIQVLIDDLVNSINSEPIDTLLERFKNNNETLKFFKENLKDNLLDISGLDTIKKQELLILLEQLCPTYDVYIGMFDDATNKLNEAKRLIIEAEAKLEFGKDQFIEGELEIEDAQKEIAKARIDLNNANYEYDENYEKYQDGIDKLDEFKDDTDEIRDYGYQIVSKSQLVSRVNVKSANDVLQKCSFSLALLFIIVGLLVCYSALSRVVNGQVVLIGTKKAVGLSEKEIYIFYFGFSLSALFLGAVFGILIGAYIIEPLVNESLSNIFVLKGFRNVISLSEFITIILIEFVFIVISTFIAVRNVLNRNAIDLLADVKESNAKTRFYQNWKIYQRMSLLSQIIINNFFTDTRRVIGTIIGIAGSTMLIVTAFTFSDILNGGYDIQFNEYFHFDNIVYFDHTCDSAENELINLLDKSGLKHTSMMFDRRYLFGKEGDVTISRIFVPDNVKEFSKFMTPVIRDGEGDPFNGTWMSYSFKKEYGLDDEAIVEFSSLSGDTSRVKVDGYIDHNLIYVQVYMDKDTYLNEFGSSAYNNAIIIDSNGKDISSLYDDLLNIDGFVSIEDYAATSKEEYDINKSLIQTLVVVYVALAIALSILVLLNLFTMFVNEKKKELIVMMINGYPIKDAMRYIYSDSIVLTVIGIVIGVILGEILGNLAVASFENIATCFRAYIDIKAALIGSVASVILVFIMSSISLSRIPRFKLVDIGK